jgi:hypothetical protein
MDFNIGPYATIGVSGEFADDARDNAIKGQLSWLF